jgi:cobalt-zinc-cadmium resistance protein CzcA
MRYGGDSMKTIEGIHERIAYIRENHLLPPGMDIEPLYDRASLVHVTTHTVLENVVEGMLLVTLVLWVFLGRAKAALITAVNLPLALALAFIGMVGTDTPANLISLGAVDFGIVGDSTVIMMENIFRHLGRHGRGTPLERIAAAAAEVGAPMFSSTLIIAVAFIPLFTMTGVAGVIFSPMAHTYAFAIGGAIMLALTLTPVLALKLMKPEVPAHELQHAEHAGPSVHATSDEEEHAADNFLMRALDRFYTPLFAFAFRRKGLSVVLVTVPVVLMLGTFAFLGREFMPRLEEGNFWIRATLPMSISLETSSTYVGRMRAILLGCPHESLDGCTDENRSRPEVRTVISQLGRPDDGTDVSGFYNIELLAPLAPADEWRKGVSKDQMTDELSAQLEAAFPGVVFNFSQAIADNVEEAMSGVKGENTVKVVGPDLHVDSHKAEEIVQVMSQIHGVTDLGIFQSLGQPSVRITPDRTLAGRYGLNVGDVEAVVQAAVGGQAVTQVYEGEKHFDLTVRWKPEFRADVESIKRILIPTPDGAQVPLGQVSQVVLEEGPSVIYREDNRRYVPVKFSVRGRDLASTIEEAQTRLRDAVKLPYDTHLEWAGEINQLHDTTARLALIIPLTLLLITFIVFSSVKTWRDTAIVLAGIPVACSGGVAALWLSHTHFSISAAMGFISIFGIAIQDALLVVSYAQRLWEAGAGVEEGARLAAQRRLRPVLMTISVAMLGLMPAALSRGIGSETQKPLALVVIGGALMLAILPRLLQPALLVLAHKNDPVKTPSAPPDAHVAQPA